MGVALGSEAVGIGFWLLAEAFDSMWPSSVGGPKSLPLTSVAMNSRAITRVYYLVGGNYGGASCRYCLWANRQYRAEIGRFGTTHGSPFRVPACNLLPQSTGEPFFLRSILQCRCYSHVTPVRKKKKKKSGRSE
eukprot:FR736791.1.p1 GENE.FR736791.1~~FR736791.1.p1  ORF type:complete len:134 (+),score=15.07 FR736791.1:162-563(+)